MTHSQEYLTKLFSDFKKRLKEVNMTQKDAANEFKITRSHLNKVLNGRTDGSLALIKQIENFTYANGVPSDNKFYVRKNGEAIELTNFLQQYTDELITAAANLDKEYSYKIFIYLFTKLYCPSENEENLEAFSIEELCNYIHCSFNEILPSLDELTNKGYLIQHLDENNEIESFGFDISPDKENNNE